VRAALAIAALGCLAANVAADVYVLNDGDRITGKTVAKGKSFTVQTPYGRLTIPRAKIERILHDDGSLEVVTAAPEPPPTPPPPVRLVVIITGKTFWQAWDPPKGVVVDPTLRLQMSLDEETVATYLDTRLDPGEIKGAMVNAFGFGPEEVGPAPASGVVLLPPETRPGRIVLKLDLPSTKAGRHRFRFAYQANDGSDTSPAWRDIVDTAIEMDLKADAPTFVDVQQDAGRMEFSGLGRRKMKNLETFRIQARTEAGGGSS
jgi:hypothetical protein